VWVLAALYLWALLRLGWIPHDDGALGQAADWVNQGLLPHRDFVDVYTGGLSSLHALAFRWFRPTLLTLRLVLFAAFLAWVPAVFYIASRLAGVAASTIVTLVAIAWSVPNYPASMPSWYNLFFATFGVAALFRYIEHPRARWLFVAGLCGGLSFLMKVVGLYYVAGVLLYLVFRAQHIERSPSEEGGSGYAVFVSACLAMFVVVLAMLVRRAFRLPELVQFVLPGAAVAAFLSYNEWTNRANDGRRRFLALVSECLPFFAGVALPIALFLAPYAISSAVGDFVNGVFVLPMRRFSFAAQAAPPIYTVLALLPIMLWAVIGRRIPERLGLPLVGAMLAMLLALSGSNDAAYRSVWYAARGLLPVLAVAGLVTLIRRRSAPELDPRSRERAVLLLSVTAICALVQFPYASSIYLSYIAPLIALTALAFLGFAGAHHRKPAGMLGAFLIAFAVLRTNLTDLRSLGQEYRAKEELRMMETDRGGIAVPVVHADVYEALVARLRVVSRNGAIWASPDSPEVYFLTGLPGVARAPFEFFDDRQTNEASILAAIDSAAISAVVIQTSPSFSPPVSQSLYRQLAQRFPLGQKFGPFLLMWRQ
jgi:hypothetical protein